MDDRRRTATALTFSTRRPHVRSTTRTSRRALATLFTGAVVAVTATMSHADAGWPTKPGHHRGAVPGRWRHRRVCPPVDGDAQQETGKQFIIDNRGGAGGTVGASIAAKADTDGYTFFMGRCITQSHRRCTRSSTTTSRRALCRWRSVSSVPQVIVVNPQRVAANDPKVSSRRQRRPMAR